MMIIINQPVVSSELMLEVLWFLISCIIQNVLNKSGLFLPLSLQRPTAEVNVRHGINVQHLLTKDDVGRERD